MPPPNHGLHELALLARFEVSTAVTMKNGILWDVTPCGSCKNRPPSSGWLLVRASVVPSSIKMDLWEIGVNDVDWIGLAQDRYRWRALVNSVMNLPVP
jgi:hypothetical protein